MATKGVIIEFDFTAVDGAQLLFATAKAFLDKLDGIAFDRRIEAKYFAGNDLQDGLAALFAAVKTKKTVLKATRDLTATFVKALNEAVPKAITPAFRNFVKALTDKGLRVIIATRSNPEAVATAFATILTESVMLYEEKSLVYGCASWESWRRACLMAKRAPCSMVAVTGSGFGVKAALRAGIPALAVCNDHVSYQDFSGANDIVRELGTSAAKKVLGILRIN